MNTNTKILIAGIGGVLLIWLLYTWLSGPTHVGDLNVNNGKGEFQHEDFRIELMHAKGSGQLDIMKVENRRNADYEEYASHRVEGELDLMRGQWTIEIPIPASLLSKYKTREEIGKRLFITIETPTISSMGDGSIQTKKQIIETLIDLETGVAFASIPLDGSPQAVGEYTPRVPETSKPAFSFFPKAYGQDWSGRLETAKYRFVYFSYCLRHYTAFSVDKRISKNGYFKAYAPIELSRLAMDEALTYLEDAMRVIESDLGMTFEGLKKPIYVEIFNKPKGTAGEFYAPYFLQGGGVLELNAKFFEKRPSLLTENEKNELRVTCGHELLHLVQEYYRDVGGISKEKIHWLDEATAVYAESLFSKQKGVAPDLTSTYKEQLGTVPLYHNHKKLNFANRQNFGYGASYLIFYLANNSAYKSRVVGAIYNKIKAKYNPAAAFNTVFFMDTYWPKFWETAFTQPNKIYPGLKYAVGHTVKLEQQNTTASNLKFKISSDLNTVIKKKTNTSLDLQVKLENLTALPIDFMMNPNRAKNKDFINNPEAKVHLNLEGDTEGIQLLVLYRKGGHWLSKGLGKSGNTLNLVTQEEKKNFRLVFINNNDNLAELSTRQLKVHLEWSMGDQPQVNPNFEAQLQKLEQWRAFCAKQKQAQQQSNRYLRNYYKEKEQEYKLAIKILKEEGELIYEVIGEPIQPDDPVQLTKNLTTALGIVLDSSVKSKQNLEKMEQMANESSGDDRKGYRQVANFFKHRRQAYHHLMSYITAVRKAQELADNNGGNNSNSGNNYSNNNNNKASHQGVWKIKGNLSGTITVGAKTLNINLSGRSTCELLVNATETREKRQFNIQLNNVPYRLDGSFVYVDRGNLDFTSAYNYYSLNDKSAIRMQLSTGSGQLDLSYISSIETKPYITRMECENMYLKAKKK